MADLRTINNLEAALYTYDVFYTGLGYPQRLTEDHFPDPESAAEVIPGIIAHTEQELGYAVDDPECYQVKAIAP